MQSARTLKWFTLDILDEIYERDIILILLIIEEILPTRPDLKVVRMSATLNATQFSYLNNWPVLHIPGFFMYLVTTFYLEDTLEMTEYILSSSLDQYTTQIHPW